MCCAWVEARDGVSNSPLGKRALRAGVQNLVDASTLRYAVEAFLTSMSATSSPRSVSPGVGADAPAYKSRHPTRKVPFAALRRDETARFVLFNTGEVDKPSLWRAFNNASPDLARSIVRIELKTLASGGQRADLWIRKELGDALKRSVLAAAKDYKSPKFCSALRYLRLHDLPRDNPRALFPWWWRIDVYRPWRDRVKPKATAEQVPRDVFRTIATWNVNGYHSKSDEICEMLKEQRVAVAAIQETLVGASSKPIRPKGYKVYASPWEEGFRGQVVLVDDRLSSYRIPREEPWLIHVKISNWKCGERIIGLHILAVYLPSGGNYRGSRTRKVEYVSKVAAEILRKHPKDYIVGLGDWNTSFSRLNKRLAKARSVLTGVKTTGSCHSRWPAKKNGKAKDLDHFIGSIGTHSLFKPPRVWRKYVVSDHRPVLLETRATQSDLSDQQEKRTVWDLNQIKRCKVGLVDENRWTILAEQLTDEPREKWEDLRLVDNTTRAFVKSFDEVCREHGIKKEVIDSEHRSKLPKALKAKLSKLHELESLFETAVKNEEEGVEEIKGRYKKLRKAYRKAKAKWQHSEEQKGYNRIATSLSEYDHKSAWQEVRNASHSLNESGANEPMKPGQPLLDKHGELRTDPEGIQSVMSEHYKALFDDVPDDNWYNHWYWRDVIYSMERRVVYESPVIDSLNTSISWRECLMSIRNMNGGTAPGEDGLHINVFKALLHEESMREWQRTHPDRPKRDNVQVHLSAVKLPKDPLTPLGRLVFWLITNVWRLEWTPRDWCNCIVVSLYKKGNPELPTNYRGITLISVLQKILMGVMLDRLVVAIDKKNLLGPNQAGFRKGEEAIAQVVCLTELVRRRSYSGEVTVGVFVDYKKAYDKVPHELLWVILERCGIRGRWLEMLRNIYSNTSMVVRTGNQHSEPIRLKRGLRQGCLDSPPLYSLFIHTMMEMVDKYIDNFSAGKRSDVFVPGKPYDVMSNGTLVRKASLSIPSLLYADDLFSPLTDDVERWDWEFVQYYLEALTTVAERMGAAVGFEKCGVILWTDNEQLRTKFKALKFEVCNQESGAAIGTFPLVEEYKYLGIDVDESLPYARDVGFPKEADTELKYAKKLAQKGRQALFAARPLLKSENCLPKVKAMTIKTLVVSRMTYGSELLGMNLELCKPQERVLEAACKWALGISRKSKAVNTAAILYELDLRSMEEITVAARTRLWSKAARTEAPMKTYLHDLVLSKPAVRRLTWTSGTVTYLKKLLAVNSEDTLDDWGRTFISAFLQKDREDAEGWWDASFTSEDLNRLPEWVLRGRLFEMHVRSNKYTYNDIDEARRENYIVSGYPGRRDPSDVVPPIDSLVKKRFESKSGEMLQQEVLDIVDMTGKSKNSFWQNKLVRAAQDAVLKRTLERKVNKDAFYFRYSFGITRGFHRSTLATPELVDGVKWLTRIRVGAFVEAKTIREGLIQRGDFVSFDDEACPLCCEAVTPGWEWAHLMVTCVDQKVQAIRFTFLRKVLPIAKSEARCLNWVAPNDVRGVKGVAGRSGEYSVENLVSAILLAGGSVGGQWGSSLTVGYGQCELIPRGLDTFVYVYICKFLQRIMPLYLCGLRLGNPGETEELRL